MPSPLSLIKKMYSPLERAVVAHKLETMPSSQWAAYIKANAPKAAKKEALAIKLDELLARQPKLSKADIVKHIQENSPKVSTKNIRAEGYGSDETQYGKYVLPGGEDYTETLIHLPPNTSSPSIRMQKVFEIADENGQLLASGTVPMSPRTLEKLNNNPNWVVREYEQPHPADILRDPSNFTSGHFDEPNVLAHLRTNIKLTPDNKDVLFLEELQSDWAQQGRKKGFLTPDLHVERRAQIKAEMDALAKEATAMRERGESPVDIRQRMRQLDDALRDIPTPKGVPSGPYIEDTADWTALGLKKAIERAVDEGQSHLAWTTGTQQADRYNLAKQIDSINHSMNPDGTYSFSAIKNGEEVLSKEGLTQDELADHLGKDIAEKIVKSEGADSPAGTSVGWEAAPSIYGDVAAPPQPRTLSGLDLQVGGEGMRTYYDQIVPSTANDILKSMGVTERVKPIGVQLGNNVSEQMGFDITPEIRDYVMNQGLPAFAGGGVVKATAKEMADLLKLYHGGRKFEQWNPKMIGMGEGAGRRNPLMAQGPGLYAGDTTDLAKIYLKYGGDDPALTELSVDPTNIINYYKKMPPEHLEKVKEAESRLDALGLRTSNYGLQNAWLGGREADPQRVRDILVNSGVDGLQQYLNPYFGTEFSIFNPDIIKRVRTMDSSEYAEGGPVHMDEGGLNVRASGDYGNFDSESSSGSHYNFSTDVDILNKYGFGVTKEGQVFKLPERTYTYEDGYTETVPARKIKRDDISELRARYMTDDGVQYGVGRQPLAKGWSAYRTDPRTQATVGFNVSPQYKNLSVYRSDPRDQSSVGVNVSPYYKGINYTKNFAEGGAVETDDVDYDELYEFRDYGDRETGEAKDTGALGEIRMPNGRDVMTEYSINVDGREMPSIVEGMHPADVNYIRETGIVPEDAVATAVRSANKREASGQSPFWNKKDEPAFAEGGEVDYDAMYEFKDNAPGFAKGGPVLSVGRGEKLPVSQGAGLTAKGRAKYNAATGSNLKAPAPHPKTEKDAGRRKSFCARMSGMPGPMKDENGNPTRKAASLKRWNCN
jgi:hypothetical protein